MSRQTFPAWPTSVPVARSYVTGLLEQVPPGICETAGLLVSELATNVVRHTDAASFVVDVEDLPGDGLLRVGVSDTGADLPVVRTPGPTAERGRGIQLVSVLADRWGARRARSGGEKTVWFELRYVPVPEAG
jgi:anti-sigma regulatory factor (Ser/Thr protein kinase)